MKILMIDETVNELQCKERIYRRNLIFGMTQKIQKREREG